MMMSFWYWKVKVLPFWLDLVSLPSTWAAFTAACSVFFQSIPPSFFTCLSFFVLFAKSLGVERYFCRQVPCLQCVSTPQLTKPITSSSKVLRPLLTAPCLSHQPPTKPPRLAGNKQKNIEDPTQAWTNAMQTMMRLCLFLYLPAAVQ